jgi:hypothetical protein
MSARPKTEASGCGPRTRPSMSGPRERPAPFQHRG